MTVIDIFKEIALIPRETGNEGKIADYLCQFAQKRNLKYYRDEYNNVIIKKKTIDVKPLILQAHTDMVCEKDSNINFNFEKDSIEVIEENGFLKANGTTLGADNGIGVAQILYILDSDIKCNIEAVFTVSEETTMNGAFKLDTNKLDGKMLLNLDGFKEDTIIIESAAFYDIIFKSNYKLVNSQNKYEYKLKLFGLKGGHSGFDINKDLGNSSILLAEILKEVKDVEILSFIGGTKFNVIPSEAEAVIKTNLQEDNLKNIVKLKLEKINRKELTVNIEKESKKRNSITDNQKVLSIEETKKFIDSIINFPHGVININEQNETTTSVNLGVVNLKENMYKIGMRSSRKDEAENCIEKLKKYAKNNNLEFELLGYQPGFQTNRTDKIIEILKNSFNQVEENKDRKLNIQAVHVAVEIGIIKEKMPDLQVAIISPNIQGAHSTSERVEIDSILRTTKWLEKFIEIYNKS